MQSATAGVDEGGTVEMSKSDTMPTHVSRAAAKRSQSPMLGLLAAIACGFLLPQLRAQESGKPSQPAILKIAHNPEKGTTSIDVAADPLPPHVQINIFRSEAPIAEENLIFCAKIAALRDKQFHCVVEAPDSGKFYYALTTSDKYGRQNRSLLKTTQVGPVEEVCRTPLRPPMPYRQCTKEQAFLCWLSQSGRTVAKYRVYRHEKDSRTPVGEVEAPEISGVVSFKIPVTLDTGVHSMLTVTTVNTSGLESIDSAPVSFALRPDLEISTGRTIARNVDFRIGRMFPLVNKPVKLGLTVHNRGLTAAKGVRVMLCDFHDKTQTSACVMDRQVDIEADQSATLEFDWTPDKLGEHHLRAVVDPLNRIPEIEEGNNRSEVLVPVIKRNLYFVWYGNPLETDWCNVPHTSLTDVEEWKRRGAVGAFCGMVGKVPSYRERLKAGFNGTVVDEIGAHNKETSDFLRDLTALKTEFPDFFIGLWQAAYPAPDSIANPRIDLYVGENYYNMRVPPENFDFHIENGRKMGIIHKYIFGLGASAEEATFLTHTATIHEEAAFLEKEMMYIRKNAPEMPGVGFYGSRPGMSRIVDEMCYRHFVVPQFDETETTTSR